MIEILSDVIINFIKKITDKSIDFAGEKSHKRIVLSSLINFFNAIDALESALININNLFKVFSDKQFILNTYIEPNLKTLFEECEKFIEEYKKVKSVLSIYDDDLTISIDKFLGTDSTDLFRLYILLEYLPKQEIGEHGLLSTITYPISKLNIMDAQIALSSINYESNISSNTNNRDFDVEIKFLKKEILKIVRKKTIDLSNLNELKLIIELNKKNIAAINEVKELLKKFIRSNFQIDMLFD